MINLLAILLSMAMMLTGTSGSTVPLDEPVARVLTLSDLTVSYNNKEVTLNPALSVGVMTDGEEAVCDFHIALGDSRLLPFQAVIDDSGILLANETSGINVKLTAEQIDQVNQQINAEIEEGLASADEQSKAMLSFMVEEFLPAYADLLKLAGDKEAMAAFEKTADGIYDEVVERGEGSPAQIDYDGETYDVVTYSYILDSRQIGRLTDAVYAANEVLDNYAKAYFKLLQMASGEEAELQGIDSFEEVMALVDMRLNITESISEADALNISDVLIQISIPDLDDPFEIDVHSEELGDRQEAVAAGEYEIEGTTFEIYVDSAREGDAMRGTITISGDIADAGTADAGTALVEDAEAADEADEPDEPAEAADGADDGDGQEPEEVLMAFAEALAGVTDGEVDVIDKEEITSDVEDGETDAEDDFYTGIDFYIEPGEDGRAYGVSWSLDVKDVASVNFNVEGIDHSDGTCENLVNVYAYDDEETYEVSFRVDVTDAPFAVNADEEKAVSIDAVDTETLMAGITGDAMRLYAEPSVRELAEMFSISDVDVGDVEEDKEDVGEDADTDEADEQPGEGDAEDAAGRSAEPYDDGVLAFGEPAFGWLPDGYAVAGMDVDTQYDMVDCELVNADTGDAIYVYFSTSINGDVANYTFGEDGSVSAIESPVFVEELDGDYHRFTVDDGRVAISMYPYAEGVDAATIGRILAGITYQDQAA